MNMVRARTSSQDPAFRLLLVMVALLVVNYWVASQWRHVSEPRRGGRKVHHEELKLETVRRLLDSVLELIYPLRAFYIVEGA